MARDYSSRRNNPPPKNGKRKPTKRAAPAAKPNRQTAGRRGGTPGAVWLLCGLFIGVTVAAGFYIFGRPAGTPSSEQVSIALPRSTAPAAAPTEPGTAEAAHPQPSEKAEPETKPRFSFYKMLPNYEVEIDESSNARTSRTPNYAPHDVEPSDTSPKPVGQGTPTPSQAPTTTSSPPSSSGYVIQAGAFSTAKDAERRKAQLALLGLSADVMDINLSSGKTVYRVQTGTIASQARVDDFMRRLRKNNIEGLVRQAPN